MNLHRPILFGVVSASLLCAGCETPGQTSLLGAGIGATIASATGHSPLRGAGIGAGAGYLLGRAAQHERREAYEEGYYEGRGGHRYAHRTARYGVVRSPYYPYNLVDIRGIPHGARVVDPSTERTFINP